MINDSKLLNSYPYTVSIPLRYLVEGIKMVPATIINGMDIHYKIIIGYICMSMGPNTCDLNVVLEEITIHFNELCSKHRHSFTLMLKM